MLSADVCTSLKMDFQCFVVLAEVTACCYRWHFLNSWKQNAILYRNVCRPSSRCYQHRKAACSMSAIQCFAQAYSHGVFSSAVSIPGHSQLDPKFTFALDTAVSQNGPTGRPGSTGTADTDISSNREIRI
jgi:hypothetical protein